MTTEDRIMIITNSIDRIVTLSKMLEKELLFMKNALPQHTTDYDNASPDTLSKTIYYQHVRIKAFLRKMKNILGAQGHEYFTELANNPDKIDSLHNILVMLNEVENVEEFETEISKCIKH